MRGGRLCGDGLQREGAGQVLPALPGVPAPLRRGRERACAPSGHPARRAGGPGRPCPRSTCLPHRGGPPEGRRPPQSRRAAAGRKPPAERQTGPQPGFGARGPVQQRAGRPARAKPGPGAAAPAKESRRAAGAALIAAAAALLIGLAVRAAGMGLPPFL